MLRLLPIGHGLPGLYVPDTHSVRNALGMLKDKNPAPRANQYSSYPYLYSYLCIPLFAGDYAAARATGRAHSAAEYQQWAGAHLERFHYLARWISAFAGAAAAAAAVYLGAMLAGRRAGLFAGLFAATGPMFLLLSTHERPWSCVLLFETLAALYAVKAVRDSKMNYFILSASSAGAAVACHQVGAAAFALPCAAAWFAFPGFGGDAMRRMFSCIGAAFAAFIVLFLIGNPYYIIKGGVETTKLTEITDFSVGGQGLKFKFSLDHTGEAISGILGLEGIVCILGIVGAFYAYSKRDRAGFILLAFSAPLVLFFIPYHGTHARYFMIAFPAAWAFAGLALDRLSARSSVLLPIVAIGIPLIFTFRLDQLLLRDDTRNLAIAELEHRIPEHARVAVEPYGPELRADVESLKRFAAAFADGKVDPLTRRERLVLDRNEPGGFDLLPLERYIFDAAPGQYTDILPAAKKLYSNAGGVPEFLREARPEYAVRVDRFPGEPRDDAFVRWLQKNGEMMFEISPSAGGAPLEALLPFEPRLGAWSLWMVNRPGPRIQLYQIKR